MACVLERSRQQHGGVPRLRCRYHLGTQGNSDFRTLVWSVQLRQFPIWRASALVFPVLVFLGVYAVYAPDVPLITPDSEGYLEFAPSRTGGYPFFLALLKPVVRDLHDYAIAQRSLYAIAILILCWQLLATTNSLIVALVAELALLGNRDLSLYDINKFHFTILTESIFLSTSALLLACAMAYLRTGTGGRLSLASALAGYATAIRPTGLAFFPALVVLAAAAPGRLRLWSRMVIIALCFAGVLALESVYYRAHHPGPRTSMLPVQMLGKAGMIDVPDAAQLISSAPQPARPLQQALETSLAPVRKLISEAPNLPARCWLLVHYETFVEYRFALPERAALVAASGNEGLLEAAFARLRSGLRDYLRVTGDHLACLWSSAMISDKEATMLAAYLASHRPLPFEEALPEFRATSLPALALRRAMMEGVGIVLLMASLGLIAMLVRRRTPNRELTLAGFCGVTVHAGVVLTALTGVGIARYTEGLWVPIAIGTGMSVLWIYRTCKNARIRTAAPFTA